MFDYNTLSDHCGLELCGDVARVVVMDFCKIANIHTVKKVYENGVTIVLKGNADFIFDYLGYDGMIDISFKDSRSSCSPLLYIDDDCISIFRNEYSAAIKIRYESYDYEEFKTFISQIIDEHTIFEKVYETL